MYFVKRRSAQGDVLAESRGGKEDRRLKDAYSRLWEKSTQFVPAQEFRSALTSRQLKVKQKTNNGKYDQAAGRVYGKKHI